MRRPLLNNAHLWTSRVAGRPHTAWTIALLTLLVVVALIAATPVPRGNESVYLLQLYRAWQPEFLSGDWTFAKAGSEHWLFNKLVGVFAFFVPLEVIAWLGRITCWVLSLVCLLLIGRRFGLGPWLSVLAITAWLSIGQSLVGGSWVIGGFEAKTVSYVLLLGAILQALRMRFTGSALLAGLSFSLHPSVGALGGFALLCALGAAGLEPRRLLSYIAFALITALPGLIQAIPLALEAQASDDAITYLTLVRLPHHLDPYSWSKEALAALGLAFGATVWYAWENRGSHLWRGILGFQAGLFVPFVVGLIARALGWYSLLLYFPFRLLPLFTPLVFFLSLAHLVLNARTSPVRPLTLIGFLAVLATLPSPLGGLHERIQSTVTQWTRSSSDLDETLAWASRNLPEEAKVLSAPWRKDVWYAMRRPTVVNESYFPYGELAAWRERGVAVYGDLPQGASGSERLQAVEDAYNNMRLDQVDYIRGRYGLDYLISSSQYPLPVVYRHGSQMVYEVPAHF